MASMGSQVRSLGGLGSSVLARYAFKTVRGESITRHAANGQHKLQIFVSTEADPFLNLSTEQHLLEVSHPSSTVLFLYANRPSVVIGRSQNPWLEVNLARLRAGLPKPSGGRPGKDDHRAVPVGLVRRRSGGGAVFHDLGNANWSVIFPTAEFDRDRHAEMVVRALRDRLGVRRVRVNDRHDIVMDPAQPAPSASSSSSSSSPSSNNTFKVSGSAYRVTRLRSLHHGTCLVRSPYLNQIGPLLRAPAADPFLKARGAGSVRSPVSNINGSQRDGSGALVDLSTAQFNAAVVDEFLHTYQHLAAGDGGPVVYQIDASAMDIPSVAKGHKELTSPEWLYNQTPQFTFSTHPTEADPRERPPLPFQATPNFNAHMTIRHGKITESSFRGLVDEHEDVRVSQGLLGLSLYDISDWRQTLAQLSPRPLHDPSSVGGWMNDVFGNGGPELAV